MDEKPKSIYEELEPYVLRFQNGDRDAFEKIYEKLYLIMKRTILSTVRQKNSGFRKADSPTDRKKLISLREDEVEEVVHEVVVLLLEGKIQNLKNPRALVRYTGMCCVSALNRYLEYQQKYYGNTIPASLQSGGEDDDADGEVLFLDEYSTRDLTAYPASTFENREAQELVAKLIENLNTDDQQIILMWMDRVPEKEIADKLGYPLQTIKNRISRSKKKLGRKIDELPFDDQMLLHSHGNTGAAHVLAAEIHDSYGRIRNEEDVRNALYPMEGQTAGEAAVAAVKRPPNRMFYIVGGSFLMMLVLMVIALQMNRPSIVRAYQAYLNEELHSVNRDLPDADSVKEVLEFDVPVTAEGNSRVTYLFTAAETEEGHPDGYTAAITDSNGVTTYNVGAYQTEGDQEAPAVLVRYYNEDKELISSYTMEEGKRYYVVVENNGSEAAELTITDPVYEGDGWYLDPEDGTLYLEKNQKEQSFKFDSRVQNVIFGEEVTEIAAEQFAGAENIGEEYTAEEEEEDRRLNEESARKYEEEHAQGE